MLPRSERAVTCSIHKIMWYLECPHRTNANAKIANVNSRLPVRAKDTINQLKEEISNLSKLVEKGAGLSVGQENMVKELIRVRDDLTRKTDEQGQTIAVGGFCM